MTTKNNCKERKKTTEVLLYGRLREALKRINPEIDDDGITDAINQIREDSFPFSYPIMETNEKIHAKMAGLSQSGGLEPITVDQYDQNGLVKKTIKLFDFDNFFVFYLYFFEMPSCFNKGISYVS